MTNKEIQRVEHILENLAFENEDDAKFLGKYIDKLIKKIKTLEEKSEESK